jgi:hypothetical protein
MKLNRKYLRKLIIESIQEQYDARPSEWQEVEALRGIDMDMYEKQFGGERQTREPSPQERGELLAKRAQWKAEQAGEMLDEDWLVTQLDGYMIDFASALETAKSEFPDLTDHEEILLRVIADSKILHLDSDTQQIHY